MSGNSLAIGFDDEMRRWIGARIPHVGEDGFGPCTTIGVVRGGRLIAGVAFHDYQPQHGTIQVSMAADSPLWARHETIAAMLKYPFEQLGVYKIWTGTPHDNELALKVNYHIGFKREAVLAHQFGRKRHGVICRMLQPDYWRLYGGRNGQQETAVTA